MGLYSATRRDLCCKSNSFVKKKDNNNNNHTATRLALNPKLRDVLRPAYTKLVGSESVTSEVTPCMVTRSWNIKRL